MRVSRYKLHLEIPFTEIVSIERKRDIKLTLKNGKIYSMNVVANAPMGSMRGYQAHNIANRTHERLHSIVRSNWNKKR